MASKPRGKAAKPTKARKPGPAPAKQDGLDQHEAAIIEGFRGDQGYRATAQKYGVSVGTLSAWIARNPERSHACARARQDSARQCDEIAEEEIRQASDPFELARAKELATHLRWRAKARDPGEFGDKVKLDATVAVRSVSDDVLLAELQKLGIAAKIGPQPDAEAPGA